MVSMIFELAFFSLRTAIHVSTNSHSFVLSGVGEAISELYSTSD